MARDAICLLDHLGIEQGAVVGYSMPAAVALRVALRAPRRVRCLVLGGTTGRPVRQTHCQAAGRHARIAAALLANDPDAIDGPTGRAFVVWRRLPEPIGPRSQQYNEQPDGSGRPQLALPSLLPPW
jgi:pimeloyl-ACP methyl ester carboxylesterase